MTVQPVSDLQGSHENRLLSVRLRTLTLLVGCPLRTGHCYDRSLGVFTDPADLRRRSVQWLLSVVKPTQTSGLAWSDSCPPPIRPLSPKSRALQWAQYSRTRTAQHMGMDHRGRHVGMPEQLLHGANVVVGLQQVGGKTMPQRMTAHTFVDATSRGSTLHRFLNCAGDGGGGGE